MKLRLKKATNNGNFKLAMDPFSKGLLGMINNETVKLSLFPASVMPKCQATRGLEYFDIKNFI